MPVRLPVRLGIINSGISLNYSANRPSWPTSPYQLSSFVPVRLSVPKVQKYKKKTNKKLVELRNRWQSKFKPRFKRRPEKILPEEIPVVKNVQEIWVGTINRGQKQLTHSPKKTCFVERMSFLTIFTFRTPLPFSTTWRCPLSVFQQFPFCSNVSNTFVLHWMLKLQAIRSPSCEG